MSVEKIEFDNKLFAIIIRSNLQLEGSKFFTPDHFTLQLGAHFKKVGSEIVPHKHLETQKLITSIQEMLHIQSGKLEANFYDDNGQKIASTILHPDDTILLVEGGHGFMALEDCKFFEIKQGPYGGVTEDKIKFGDKH